MIEYMENKCVAQEQVTLSCILCLDLASSGFTSKTINEIKHALIERSLKNRGVQKLHFLLICRAF